MKAILAAVDDRPKTSDKHCGDCLNHASGKPGRRGAGELSLAVSQTLCDGLRAKLWFNSCERAAACDDLESAGGAPAANGLRPLTKPAAVQRAEADSHVLRRGPERCAPVSSFTLRS